MYDAVFFVIRNRLQDNGERARRETESGQGKLKIIKVISNNVVSAREENGEEIIVTGAGIGFQKKRGDIVSPNKVEKVFHLSDAKMTQFEQMVKNMPLSCIRTAEKIITYAKDTLSMELNENIHIALTDHLNFAIERMKKGLEFRNALLWEIKRFYPKEFAIGLEALRIIKENMGVELSEDEAGFFALHVVNAELSGDESIGMQMPQIIKDILNIVQFTTGTEMKEDSLSYERFIRHLKFFLQRALADQMYGEEDMIWAKGVPENCPDAYKCALRIKSYVKAKLHYETTDTELIYLTVHIHHIITQDGRQKK